MNYTFDQDDTRISEHNYPWITQVEILPKLPPYLKKLNVTSCQNLVKLPELPESLRELYCNGCINLEKFPQLPTDLEILACKSCRLYLPVLLPTNLLELDCELSKIEIYLANLEIYVSNNWNSPNSDCSKVYKEALAQLHIPAILDKITRPETKLHARRILKNAYEACKLKYKNYIIPQIMPKLDEYLFQGPKSVGPLVAEYLGFKRSRKIKKRTRKSK